MIHSSRTVNRAFSLLLLTLTITGVALAQNPAPLLNLPVVPSAVQPRGPGFALTINGSGFVSGAVVHWNSPCRGPPGEVDAPVKGFGLKILRTPVQAPKANAYCER